MLHGFKVHKAVYIANVLKLKMMAKRMRAEKKALRIYRKRLNLHRNKAFGRSDLACIISPDTPKLSGIPAYHRFVAWVLKDGMRQAGPRLGVSRMMLYRWLVANHYALSNHRGLEDMTLYAKKYKALYEDAIDEPQMCNDTQETQQSVQMNSHIGHVT